MRNFVELDPFIFFTEFAEIRPLLYAGTENQKIVRGTETNPAILSPNEVLVDFYERGIKTIDNQLEETRKTYPLMFV